MKKKGILTFHRTANFGSCLQTYALYRKIMDLGYDCSIIDYRCEAVEKRENINKKYSFTPRGLALRVIYQPAVTKKYRNLMGFIEHNTELSKGYTSDTVSDANKEYDKIIVGSDIVWGTDITENDYTYFLDFVNDGKKKYAFSSSVGNTAEAESDKKVGELLSSFSRIAVREENMISWVERLSRRSAELVCDPTMLLTAEEWLETIPPKIPKGDYVLVYFKDDKRKCLDDARAYAREHRCRIKLINYSISQETGIDSVKPKSLSEFFGLILGAKAVFTASYHGLLFSLYFKKEVMFYRRAHSDRVISLSKRLGIDDRNLSEKSINEVKTLDYKRVTPLIEEFREQSTVILKEMLDE